jgi:AcrR family transcriptional regulator
VKKKGRIPGDHAARRVEIAEAACRAILRLGLANAGLAEIAREMGYTTGVLRHYFDDKEHLLLFAKNQLFDRAHQHAVSLAAGVSGFERLRIMVCESIRLDAEAIDRWRLLTIFNGSAIGNASLMQVQARRNERFWKLIEDELMELQRAGILSRRMNVALEARGIAAIMDGLADQIVMKPKAWKPAEVAMLLTVYLDSVLARNGTRHGMA